MSKPISLKDLSPDDRAQLLAEAKEAEKAEEKKKQENRKAYKQMASEAVPKLFESLAVVSKYLSESKEMVFKSVQDIIELKNEAYGVKEGQQSHTISSEDGSKSITLGYRVVDNYDDTIKAGIEKVKQYKATLATSKDAKTALEMIDSLMKEDANGNLKTSRVIELDQFAKKVDHPLLNDAIEIIKAAYKPVKTCYFVEAKYLDKTGQKQSLPLSISAVDFPNGSKVNFM